MSTFTHVPGWALAPVEPHCLRCTWPAIRIGDNVVHAFSLSPNCAAEALPGRPSLIPSRVGARIQPSGAVPPPPGPAEPWPPRQPPSPSSEAPL